jgi:hypothetical protein
METLVLNGKSYVKASKAAQDLGYTSDYVGQLCRGGHVDAHLVGRTWYVNPDTLTVHRVEKKRNARLKAREYAKKAIEESRSLSVNKTKNSYKNIPIRYEGDKSELIPSMRKLAVDAEKVTQGTESSEPLDTDPYILENKDKKIIMSGALSIQDADAEVVQTDTVILSPTIRRGHHVPLHKKAAIPAVVTETTAQQQSPTSAPKSFVERIKNYQDVKNAPGEQTTAEQPTDTGDTDMGAVSVQAQPTSAIPVIGYVAGLVLVSIISLLSIYIEQQVVWENQSVSTNYSLDFEEEINIGL